MTTGIEIAKKYIGLQEHKDRDKLKELFKNQGVMSPNNPNNPFDPDGSQKGGLPWCAAFITMCLREAGVKAQVRYAAREFLKYGEDVGKDLTKAKEGDILVFSRGSSSYEGHVGFFISYDKKTGWIKVLSGNKSDSVCVAFYTADRLIGVRR